MIYHLIMVLDNTVPGIAVINSFHEQKPYFRTNKQDKRYKRKTMAAHPGSSGNLSPFKQSELLRKHIKFR